jgi:rod shape-determining protein MreD
MPDTRTAIARWICFFVLILIAVTLQIMVFPRIDVLPNPLVSVTAVVSLAVFAGPVGGVAAGFIGGLMCDALLPHTEAYFTLTAMGAGALTGFLCGRGKLLQKNFLSATVMTAASTVVIQSVYVLCFHVATGRAPVSAYFTAGLPVILASVLCVPFIYPLFRLVAVNFSEDD